jgi:thioredoxin-like negative regulator of GroEL
MDRTTAVAAQYRVRGLPTHYFVDAGGVLREMKIGPMGTKEIERKLASIIE